MLPSAASPVRLQFQLRAASMKAGSPWTSSSSNSSSCNLLCRVVPVSAATGQCGGRGRGRVGSTCWGRKAQGGRRVLRQEQWNGAKRRHGVLCMAGEEPAEKKPTEEGSKRHYSPAVSAAAAASSPSLLIPSPPPPTPPHFLHSILRKVLHSLAIFLLLSLLGNAAYASLSNPPSAPSSIAKLSLGQKVASFLRLSAWPDEAIVTTVATLPVLELRGAIPVGFWMGLDPWRTALLAIVGNMIPVPFILKFLGPISDFAAARSSLAKQVLDWLFEHTRKKSGPIAEFKWLGLALFVAVPLPGTGAWSGAIGAHILGMPFWEAMSANFVGVVLAGIIVTLLCSMGLVPALIVGAILFVFSSSVWSILRWSASSKIES